MPIEPQFKQDFYSQSKCASYSNNILQKKIAKEKMGLFLVKVK